MYRIRLRENAYYYRGTRKKGFCMYGGSLGYCTLANEINAGGYLYLSG